MQFQVPRVVDGKDSFELALRQGLEIDCAVGNSVEPESALVDELEGGLFDDCDIAIEVEVDSRLRGRQEEREVLGLGLSVVVVV